MHNLGKGKYLVAFPCDSCYSLLLLLLKVEVFYFKQTKSEQTFSTARSTANLLVFVITDETVRATKNN